MGWTAYGHLGWMTLATLLLIGTITLIAWLAVLPLTHSHGNGLPGGKDATGREPRD